MHAELGAYLDDLAGRYGRDHLDSDPLVEVRRFSTPDDLEVAGFLAAGIAFGRVDIILDHLRDLWRRLDHEPARVVDGWSPRDRKRTAGFTHRWIRGEDLAHVLAALGRARRRHGSLRSLFESGHDPVASDLGPSLARFVAGVRDEVRIRGRRVPEPDLPRGVRTFFADPARGGACKRLNLYLRWMVRPDDGVDLGLWSGVPPRQLVMPLDTHVARISRYLGLTRRRTIDWKMAAEVTGALRRWDPDDPVRYDFALSRLGILDHCPRRVDPGKCRSCPLVFGCTLGRENHG